MRQEWKEIADRYTDEELIQGATYPICVVNISISKDLALLKNDSKYDLPFFLSKALAERLQAYINNNHQPQLP